MWQGPHLPSLPFLDSVVRQLRRRYLVRRAVSGEHEVYRASLPSASVFVVDRHTSLGERVSCILTDRRLTVDGSLGSTDILLAHIHSAYSIREWQERGAFHFWVAVDLIRRQAPDNRGDLCLHCHSQQESEGLADRIRTAISP